MEKADWTNIPHSADYGVPGTKPFTSSHMADAVCALLVSMLECWTVTLNGGPFLRLSSRVWRGWLFLFLDCRGVMMNVPAIELNKCTGKSRFNIPPQSGGLPPIGITQFHQEHGKTIF